MDISEDCWEHVGLLQEVSAAEPPPPPPAPDFLIQQQEVSTPFLLFHPILPRCDRVPST